MPGGGTVTGASNTGTIAQFCNCELTITTWRGACHRPFSQTLAMLVPPFFVLGAMHSPPLPSPPSLCAGCGAFSPRPCLGVAVQARVERAGFTCDTVAGASIELFMQKVKIGGRTFYDVALQKEVSLCHTHIPTLTMRGSLLSAAPSSGF